MVSPHNPVKCSLQYQSGLSWRVSRQSTSQGLTTEPNQMFDCNTSQDSADVGCPLCQLCITMIDALTYLWDLKTTHLTLRLFNTRLVSYIEFGHINQSF